jgi:hypothetical protein
MLLHQTGGRRGGWRLCDHVAMRTGLRLKDQVRVVEALFTTEYGTRKFTIADPDGNELGFADHVA